MGVPTVVQWVNDPAFLSRGYQFNPWLGGSELRIWHWCSCSVAWSSSLDLISGPGTSMGTAEKEKKSPLWLSVTHSQSYSSPAYHRNTLSWMWCHIHCILWMLFFFYLFFHLNIKHLKLIHVHTCSSSSSVLIAVWFSIVSLYHILSIL